MSIIFTLIPCLLFLSALFSAAETSLFSLPSSTVRSYQKANDKNKQLVAQLLKHPQELIVTLLMLNISVNVGLQNFISSIAGEETSWLYKVGVPLVLTLFFGEILPKSLALQYNKNFAPILAFLIRWPHRFLSILRIPLIAIVTPISAKMFFFLHVEQTITLPELKHILKTSQNDGILHREEVQLAGGYLELQEKLVKDLMRPRTDILYYDIKKPLAELMRLFSTEECSRVPVCEDGLDHLIGVLDAKTFFCRRNQIQIAQDLFPYLEKPLIVPKSQSAKNLLIDLGEKKQKLALAVDEYGDVNGLISYEDLIEVVVGKIAKRRDIQKDYVRSSENVIIANGRMPIDEFNQVFAANLKAESAITIAGWLIEKLKLIPQAGAKLTTSHFFFHVLEAQRHRVNRIYIRKLKTKTILPSLSQRNKGLL